MNKADGIYEEYADLIYKYLHRLSGSHDLSEELTQETFYQAIKNLKGFKGECKLSTWLCQIAKHCWFQYLKKSKKSKNLNIDTLSNELIIADTPETITMVGNDRIYLYRQVHVLSEPYKEVVLLRILGDLSFSEIGQIMGKTENWARVTFHRAKITLIERSFNNGN